MRFTLEMELSTSEVPIEYRGPILSYIKHSITECNMGKHYDEIFEGVKPKDYCFTVQFPKAQFTREYIQLEDKRLFITFSTNDSNKVGLVLYSAFIAQKNKNYPLTTINSMKLIKIINLPQKEIYNDRVIFKTVVGSPLCVREHNRETNKDKYYIYSDEKFNEQLDTVVSNQLKVAGFNELKINNFSIKPLETECKKVVIKHYRRYIDATVGLFIVEGDKELLQYIYDTGMGSRASFGFGMLDIVTQDI